MSDPFPFRVGDIVEIAYDPLRYQLQDVSVSADGSIRAARLVPISDDARIDALREKYVRPAVEHDPQGAADLIERCWFRNHQRIGDEPL